MNVQLRRSVTALASMCFLGLALTTATGCAAIAGGAPGVASASDAAGAASTDALSHTPADPTLTPAGEADPAIASKRLEVAGFQSLVDQETAALAAKNLTADDKAEHTTRIAKLLKMKGDSEAELATLEKPYLLKPVAPSLDAPSTVALTSAAVPSSVKVASGAAKIPGVPGLPAVASSPKLRGVPGVPAVPGIGALPATPGGIGSALGAASSAASAGKDPKGAAMGLAKLGASRIPGGGAALAAASSIASGDPKGAAMGLAKLGASHIPGGGAALGAATALASDPKAAAKDLAKQGAAAALSKAPIPGALKGSLFGK